MNVQVSIKARLCLFQDPELVSTLVYVYCYLLEDNYDNAKYLRYYHYFEKNVLTVREGYDMLA